MKPPFELMDFHFEIIMNLSSDAYDFAHIWENYLASCGWSANEFELELERRLSIYE